MSDLSSLLDLSPVFSYKEFLQYFMAGSFNENQGICMIFKCLLTDCLLLTRESKNQLLYPGEAGEQLD